MAYRLPPLNALRAFEAAARHLSFKHAAEELSVTPTAISHQIRGLEEALGVPLFRRLTRALELTPEGEAMLPKITAGLDCFAAGVEKVREMAGTPGGRLDVIAPPSFASRWLVPRLHRFYADHPAVELHLASALRAIDGSAGRDGPGEDLRGERPQLWIRFGAGRYPGFRTELLFRPGYTPVCSPRLLHARTPLKEAADLRFHNLIHDDTILDLRERPSWAEWLKAAGLEEGIGTRGGLHFTDPALAIAAAMDGLGVALVPKPMVSAELADGRLVAPFDVALASSAGYHLVMQHSAAELPAVKVFREWLLNEVHADAIAMEGAGF
ncbi:transcriptional regulator GcvA [Azoarcus indigens]|uniref:LysR family transcriptional regulator n=1 Tax=Azoarcus indigens TaxID=29545 RepID=A0A4R6E659_9RHOO|nr:transcriptional regulator GcvA [Azoarcus indigens]NMG65411.1 transcriptional regulator GcvA [Azoarcus indigens]TDN53383.1 LysR family transcriptional regulator [Azoarcus indigens]